MNKGREVIVIAWRHTYNNEHGRDTWVGYDNSRQVLTKIQGRLKKKCTKAYPENVNQINNSMYQLWTNWLISHPTKRQTNLPIDEPSGKPANQPPNQPTDRCE